jgi:nicotinamide-nucleotide amidase
LLAILKQFSDNNTMNSLPEDLEQTMTDIAAETGQHLAAHGWMLVTAESCTGGWTGQAITAIPGSSAWYERGFITYSNASKHEMLGVQQSTLDQFGAVSPQTATEMAAGALNRSRAHISVAITGIAGPDGGTARKPVGMVCFGWAHRNGLARQETHYFNGNREAIRGQAVITALQGILNLIDETPLTA